MNVNNTVYRLHLKDKEKNQIEVLSTELHGMYENSHKKDIFKLLKLNSIQLPSIIHEYLYEIKYLESFHALVIENLPILEIKQKTPTNFETIEKDLFTKDEIIFMLIASLLGDIFTWSSIQSGRIVNQIFPIKENEDKPISSSSKTIFGLHTEDAFHKYAGDYLMLLGYSNPDNIPTTVVFMGDIYLKDELKKELFKPNYIVKHNIAHELEEQHEEGVSILFGDFMSPYVRVNLNLGRTIGLTVAARNALTEFESIVINKKSFLNVGENQVAIIDNFRTMHGREEYQPRYDGTDRWLKRLYVTRDIRKSRNLRGSVNNNIIQLEE